MNRAVAESLAMDVINEDIEEGDIADVDFGGISSKNRGSNSNSVNEFFALEEVAEKPNPTPKTSSKNVTPRGDAETAMHS